MTPLSRACVSAYSVVTLYLVPFLRCAALNDGVVRGRSKSLKTAPLDKPSHTTYCQSVIVTIALSCIVFELFDVFE